MVFAGSGIEVRYSMKPDSLEDRIFLKVLACVYQDSFRMAMYYLDSLKAAEPGYWPATVFKAGIIYTEMTDDERYDREDEFKALIDSSLIGLEKHLRAFPDDHWARFFKATAMGYLAVWEGTQGSWLKAVVKGLKAGGIFSDIIKRDSLFYDAYLGVGTLHYWRSAKMGIMRSLPFISDRRQQGIKEVRLAMEKGRYTSIPAALGLCWIYIDRDEYDKTFTIVNRLLNEGITGRQLLWPRAIAAFRQHRAAETIRYFELIKEGLLQKGNQNYYNISICDFCLGLAHYWRGDDVSALKYFNDVLDRDYEPAVANRLGEKFKAAEDYKKKIKKRVAKNLQIDK